MSKLIWETEPDGSLRALGDNTGAEYLIEAGLAGGYLLFIDARPLPYGFETVAEAQEEAAWGEQDEDPNNTFRSDFAGFAGNH